MFQVETRALKNVSAATDIPAIYVIDHHQQPHHHYRRCRTSTVEENVDRLMAVINNCEIINANVDLLLRSAINYAKMTQGKLLTNCQQRKANATAKQIRCVQVTGNRITVF